jgi:hypothetical protein
MPIFDKRTPEQKAADEARKTAERAADEARKEAERAAENRRQAIAAERARRVQAAEQAIKEYQISVVPKWEYALILIRNRKDSWFFDFRGVEYEDRGPRLAEIISEMGREGWEMTGGATYVATNAPNTFTREERLYFKRPVPLPTPALAQALEEAENYGA